MSFYLRHASRSMSCHQNNYEFLMYTVECGRNQCGLKDFTYSQLFSNYSSCAQMDCEPPPLLLYGLLNALLRPVTAWNS